MILATPTRRRGSIAAALVAAIIGVNAFAFVWPQTSHPQRADAVVVFGARTSPERLERARELMRSDLARVIVIASPPDTDCSRRDARGGWEVLCVEPEPFTTRGEARAVGTLARSRGWSSLVLVTSTYHVYRAHLLLARCFAGTIATVGVPPSRRLRSSVNRIPHELGGLLEAVVGSRGC